MSKQKVKLPDASEHSECDDSALWRFLSAANFLEDCPFALVIISYGSLCWNEPLLERTLFIAADGETGSTPGENA